MLPGVLQLTQQLLGPQQMILPSFAVHEMPAPHGITMVHQAVIHRKPDIYWTTLRSFPMVFMHFPQQSSMIKPGILTTCETSWEIFNAIWPLTAPFFLCYRYHVTASWHAFFPNLASEGFSHVQQGGNFWVAVACGHGDRAAWHFTFSAKLWPAILEKVH